MANVTMGNSSAPYIGLYHVYKAKGPPRANTQTTKATVEIPICIPLVTLVILHRYSGVSIAIAMKIIHMTGSVAIADPAPATIPDRTVQIATVSAGMYLSSLVK